MKYRASMVLEGGAMTGIYSAGVIDVLMRHDIFTTHAIGVSAGSCNALDYGSGQIGRTADCMAIRDKKLHFFGFDCLLKRGKFYDFDLCFDQFGDKYFPYDFNALDASGMYVEVVATNIRTGKPVYFHCVGKDKLAMRASRASSSLPFLSDPYEVDGELCLDGGICDSIPIDRAKTYGNERIIVVLTKPHGYRKKPHGALTTRLAKIKYGKYPDFLDTYLNRYRMYNREVEEAEKLAASGKIFLIQPAGPTVGRMEKDPDKLMHAYHMGEEDMEKRLPALLAYLKGSEAVNP